MADNLSVFYQKNGITVRNISRDLLTLNVGDIMTSIAEYTEKFQVSRWTIQTAIQFLLEHKCMEIEKHGYKGTVVSKMNRKLLWEMADFNPLLGLAPPPSSDIHNSLYTGLVEAFGQSDFPVNLAYMAPATLRMQYLDSRRCHFIIVSALAAKLMLPKDEKLESVMELRGATYSLPYRLYSQKGTEPKIKDGSRVGYYQEAAEQSYMTDQLCEGKQIVKVYNNYHGCVNALIHGDIDVLVKRSDIDLIPLEGFPYTELNDTEEHHLATQPVILANKNEYAMNRLLKKYMNIKIVADKQREVLEGRSPMNYY